MGLAQQEISDKMTITRSLHNKALPLACIVFIAHFAREGRLGCEQSHAMIMNEFLSLSQIRDIGTVKSQYQGFRILYLVGPNKICSKGTFPGRNPGRYGYSHDNEKREK